MLENIHADVLATLPRRSEAGDSTTAAARERHDPLRAAAIRFEAAFLAEMLRHSGLGEMPSAFNGGAGEAAFSGTLIQEYAAKIADAGGIGLADRIFESLLGREDA